MASAAEQGYATATDFADYLVRKGLPFRDAHEAAARVVRLAVERNCGLAELPLADVRKFAPQVEDDVAGVLASTGSVETRNHVGGTAPQQVRAQVARWQEALGRAEFSPPGVTDR
jgi:argininosuccinate lyase